MLERTPVTRFTVAEYVAIEAASAVKHEYWHGELYAMAGARPEHNWVAQNVAGLLNAALADRPCHAVGGDQRVAIEAGGQYFYPDVVVACAPVRFDPQDPLAIANPAVVVEVLSPSTEEVDRGPKLDAYRRHPDVVDVLLVDVPTRTVEHWSRSDGGWERAARTAGTVGLAIGVEIPVAGIWKKLELLGA